MLRENQSQKLNNKGLLTNIVGDNKCHLARLFINTLYLSAQLLGGMALAIVLFAASNVFAGEKPKLAIDGFGESEFQRAETGPGRIPSAQQVAERWWLRTNGELNERIGEFELKKPKSPKSWLRIWQTSRGCTVEEVHEVKPVQGLGPQLTVTGYCKGGDSYIFHIVQIGSTIVELHVDSTTFRISRDDLVNAMRIFLSRIHAETSFKK